MVALLQTNLVKSGMQDCSKFFEWDARATDTFKSDSRDNQNSGFSLSVSTWGVPTEGVVLSIEIQRPLLVIILNISSSQAFENSIYL